MRLILTTLLFISALFSCKKKQINPNIPKAPTTTIDTIVTQNFQFDTVLPSDYLMVYPGSWWSYTDGHTDYGYSWELLSVFTKTSSTYNTVYINENKRYFPRASGGLYSFQSLIYTNFDTHTTGFTQVIDTVPRDLWGVYSYSGQGSSSQQYVKTIESFGKIASMDANDVTYNNVIHIQRKSVVNHHYGTYIQYKLDYYYAKGVGLIKISGVNQGTPITPIELVNYYIAPH